MHYRITYHPGGISVLVKPSADDLRREPTLAQGQTSDLKLEMEGLRWWLSRCGIEDGEPFAHAVTIEQFHQGRWTAVLTYDGDDPTAELWP